METKILPVLEKAIEIIPIDKMDFQPNDKLNPLIWLAYHAVNGPFVYLKGVEHTILTQSLFDSFKLDWKEIKDPKILLNYSSEFRKFLSEFKEK